MKLGYTIFYVADVPATLRFYAGAFGLKQKFLHESNDYGELATGETTLAFVNFKLAESNHVGFFPDRIAGPCTQMEIALISEDVQTSFERAITAGATAVVAPTRKPWGQTIGYVRDNNGFLVEICSPVP